MNKNRSIVIAGILLSLLLQACGGGIDAPDAPDSLVATASEPALTTPQDTLDKALNCTPFEHPDKPPVLLVHGAFINAAEEYTLFYTPQLVALGYDVCIIDYPDRGLGDIQISAEYVVNALRSIYAQTGRKVAMIGHSEGALMPRWALKYWPSANKAVRDFVMLAGPNHGTSVVLVADVVGGLFASLGLGDLPIGLLPEGFYQATPNSNFIAALNADDETPGDVDYTAIYTLFDELIQPVKPVPTAAVDFGKNNPQASNVLLQDVCPGYLTEHGTIGTTDPVTFALVLDAINNPGPADVTRAGGGARLCRLLPVDIAALSQAPVVVGLLQIVAADLGAGLPNPHLAAAEPPLMPYTAKP